ncbi:MAG: methyltransferase type 12 [Parcubacteria group bacterium LiPW_15]|nr:MAG: methyltransferase type 12 [Parcubacteria group bacterium LiPW_15]
MTSEHKDSWEARAYNKYGSGHATFAQRGNISKEEIRHQYPAWSKYFGRSLPAPKNSAILDAGCGNGEFLLWLKESGYSNLEGIDISEEQIARAKSLGVNAKHGDLPNFLTAQKNRYDCIIARDIIEHFSKDDLLVLLDGFQNALKPEGVLIIQTPNAEGPFGSRSRYMDFTHHLSFTRLSLGHALSLAGFEKVRFYSMGPVVHGFFSTIRYAVWKIIELGIRIYQLAETGTGAGIYTQNIIATATKS